MEPRTCKRHHNARRLHVVLVNFGRTLARRNISTSSVLLPLTANEPPDERQQRVNKEVYRHASWKRDGDNSKGQYLQVGSNLDFIGLVTALSINLCVEKLLSLLVTFAREPNSTHGRALSSATQCFRKYQDSRIVLEKSGWISNHIDCGRPFISSKP
jgi:hypothetical protein